MMEDKGNGAVSAKDGTADRKGVGGKVSKSSLEAVKEW